MTIFEDMRRRIAAQPAALWAILLLALALRLFQLSESGLWNDEAFSVNVASLPFLEMCKRIAWDGIHPPFFYFLLFPWISIFGDSEIAVRSLSVVYGVLSVLLIYSVSARFYSQRVGLVAAFLLATSSFFIFYSQDARMYMFMAPPALVSFYALYRLLFDRRLIVYAIYFVSTVIFLYTHIFGVFYVLTQNVYYLGLMVLGRKNRPKLTHWTALQSATVLAFVPWLPFVFDKAQRQKNRGTFWLEAPDLNDIGLLFISFAGSTIGFLIMTAALIAALFVGVRRALKCHGRFFTEDQFCKEGMLILWAFFPVTVTALYSILVNPILYPRYVLPSALPIYILFALAVVKWSQHSARNTAIAGLALISLTGYQLYTYYADEIRANYYRLHDDWRTATAYLVENVDENTVIICPGACQPLDYYLRTYNVRKKMIPILRSSSPRLQKQTAKLAEHIEGYEKVWLVTADGLDPEKIAQGILEKQFQREQETGFDGLIYLDLYRRVSAN